MNGIRSNPRSSARALATVLLGVASIAIAVLVTLQPESTSTVILVAMMTFASTRAARWWMTVRVPVGEKPRHRVLLIGAGSTAQHLAREAEGQRWQVLGHLEDPDAAGFHEGSADVLGPRASLPALVRELRPDRVIVTDSPASAWPVVEQLEREGGTCQVYVVPGPYELALCPPTTVRLGDVPLLRVRCRRPGKAQETVKRAFDLLVSAALLLLLGPLLLLAMLAIRLSGPGPVLFLQERVGRAGRPFRIVKLRTMVQDAERDGPQLCAGKRDPRLTPLGGLLRRTHLDEVPQLWNVLRGEMSLVGPRPERPCFVEQFERELPEYADRHRIRPGITGLAQVCGSYHSSPREKLRYDLMYLYHRSLWLDLGIILRTVLTMFA